MRKRITALLTAFIITILFAAPLFNTTALAAGLNELQRDEYFQYRESKYHIFLIPSGSLRNCISPENLWRWLQHMDAVYEAYAELIGYTPAGGEKIVWNCADNPGGAMVSAVGGNSILVASDLVGLYFSEINDRDLWSWGPLHELGHSFDKTTEPNWMFHAELTANLKVLYAVDTLGAKVELDGVLCTTLDDLYNYCYGWAVQDDGEDKRYNDKLTCLYIDFAKEHGWGAFKKTFRSYYDDSYPYGVQYFGSPYGVRLNDFIDRLGYFSGVDFRGQYVMKVWPEILTEGYDNAAADISGIKKWDDFSYTSKNNQIIITKYTGTATEVIIPDNIDGLPVTGLGEYVFFNDDGSTSQVVKITFGKNISSIDAKSLNGMPNLQEIAVAEGSFHMSAVNGVLFSKNMETLIKYPHRYGSYTVPSTVRYIGDRAFQDISVTSVTLPGGLESIGSGAFEGCRALRDITIPGGVKTIGENAFYWSAVETIYGIAGSAAERYAKANNIIFSAYKDSSAPADWAIAEIDEALAAGLVPDSIAKAQWSGQTSRLTAAEAVVAVIEKASGKTMEQISAENGWDLAANCFSDTASPYVTFLKYAKITTGVGENKYDPNGAYTRAQIVTMLGRTAEVFFGKIARGANPFTDVPDWAAPYVGYAAENGITNGIGGGLFDSDGILQNQHTAVFCLRAYKAWSR